MFNNDLHSPLIMVSHPHAPYYPQQQYKMHYQNPNPNDCYLRQHRTIEVIELEEVPPPSRHSGPCSSSAASSSYYSSSSDEDESASSYCSSDVPSVGGKPFVHPAAPQQRYQQQCKMDVDSRQDDSFKSRMHRVELWRDQYAKAVGTQFSMLTFFSFSPHTISACACDSRNMLTSSPRPQPRLPCVPNGKARKPRTTKTTIR